MAGSLGVLTRTIGTVTGATVLTIGFRSFEATALTSGAEPITAFLAGFRVVFRAVALIAAATGLTAALSARRQTR